MGCISSKKKNGTDMEPYGRRSAERSDRTPCEPDVGYDVARETAKVSAGDAETRHQSSALSTGGHGRTTDGRPVTSDVSQPPPSSPTVSTPPFTPSRIVLRVPIAASDALVECPSIC